MDPAACLFPEDHTLNYYIGHLNVGGNQYRFRIRSPLFKPSNIDLAKGSVVCVEEEFLWCEPALATFIGGYSQILKQRMKQSTNMASFLVELQEISSRVAVHNQNASLLPAPAFYAALLEDLAAVGWSKITSLNETLSSVTITTKDNSSRLHSFELKLPPDYPSNAPVCATNLPCALDFKGTIPQIVHIFEQELEKFDKFWAVMDDWDNHTWVLEPSNPPRSCTYRRIAIGKGLSVTVVAAPLQPLALCEVIFFGPDTVVDPLRFKWQSSVDSWDPTVFPRINLQNLLQFVFPYSSTVSREELNLECGICYSYVLAVGDSESVPDRVCDNVKCGRGFHHSCLFEWLKSVPSSRQSFNTIFGVCPYCSEPCAVTSAWNMNLKS